MQTNDTPMPVFGAVKSPKPPSIAAQIQARSNDYWRAIGATPKPPQPLTLEQQEAQRQCRALSDALGTDGAIKATQRIMKRAMKADASDPVSMPQVWKNLRPSDRHQLATCLALLENEIDPNE